MLTGGRLTLEDAYAYAKFARVALDTNDVDMRARAHSAEEEQFLAACVAGAARALCGPGAGAGGAAGRLRAGRRKAHRVPAAAQGGQGQGAPPCTRIAALASRGLAKLSGTLL